MPQKSSTKSAKRAGQLKIRAYEDGDRDALVALWETCDLAKPWNDPEPDIGALYARLGQRMSTWMASRTSAGMLFETDFRLRPNGDSGMLVSTLEAFHEYQLRPLKMENIRLQSLLHRGIPH